MPENPEAREQDVKDAPYLRVTTGVLTLKADSNDLPEQKHPPEVCTKPCPLLGKWKVLISSPFFWTKSLGRRRPMPAPPSFPGQLSGVRAQLLGEARETEFLVLVPQSP